MQVHAHVVGGAEIIIRLYMYTVNTCCLHAPDYLLYMYPFLSAAGLFQVIKFDVQGGWLSCIKQFKEL